MAPNGRAGTILTVFVGALLLLMGLVLTAGGIWLATLGGSLYYLLAGMALAISGWLILRRSAAGVWLYVAVFVVTVIWALWEVGLDAWALVPRIFAPGVLLILVLAVLASWRGGRRNSLLPLGGAVAASLVFLVAGLSPSPWVQHPTAELAQRGRLPTGPSLAADPARTGADWPAYGGSHHARRYSPLAQITPANVSGLKRVWEYRTEDMPEKKPGDYAPETTPLKVGDSLYLCTAMNILVALDAATGLERWRYDPVVSADAIPYSASCRGVAYYRAADLPPDAPCAERIIEGTLDARLIAVDARTGLPCPDFGQNGQVSLLEGIGDTTPGFYSVTSPPTIVRGIAVVGAQVLDGQRRDAPSGVVRGYDAVTGELRWAWDLARPELTGEPEQGDTYTRGTPNMWTIASGDEALGHVYLPMGNSAVDYYGADRRPESNEYSTSLVALDVTTGRPVWHFQTVRYDVWDYDLGSQATLIDFPTRGGLVPALILPSKQGDIYILDRRTGRPLTPAEERRVPSGGVEPQNLSPTQPFSRYHTLARRPLTEHDMWGMWPIDQLWCRIGFRRAAYEGMYTPPTASRRWIQYPGYNGGSDWGGVAVDPIRGLIIANYNDMPNYNRLLPREKANERGWAPIDVPWGGKEGDPQWGVPYAIDVNAGWRVTFTGLMCKQPPYGGIRAIDLASGRTLWDRPLGTARRNGPFGIPTMLPFPIGTPNNGGAAVTAGGLVFIAAATDNLIRAIDIETGKVLWQDALPAGGQATPIVYEQDGHQFLVVMAGGHHFMETPVGDYVIAYTLLPKGAKSQRLEETGAGH